MKKLKVFSISAILIAICCSFLFSASVSAASKKRNKFDHKPSGNIYYYDENGHTVKGLVTIRGKKYYFNEKGIQQNGWQKIKGDYYFFQIRNGCYASMVTSRRVNGIYLTKSGEARYNSEEKRKLNLMVTANQVMRRVTKRNMSKPEKLWRCYLNVNGKARKIKTYRTFCYLLVSYSPILVLFQHFSDQFYTSIPS